VSESQYFFKDVVSDKKNTLKILILGDYSKREDFEGPEDVCESQLINLKKHLISEGFLKTYLVKDFIDEEEIPEDLYDEHFVEKSEHYIEHWADILVFVLLREGDHQSVIREWGFMITACQNKFDNAILIRHEDVVLRGMLRGDIKRNQITHETFIDLETLLERAYKLCFSKIYNFT